MTKLRVLLLVFLTLVALEPRLAAGQDDKQNPAVLGREALERLQVLMTSTNLFDTSAVEKALGIALIVNAKEPADALATDRAPVSRYYFRLANAPAYITTASDYGYWQDALGKKRNVSLVLFYEGKRACVSANAFISTFPEFGFANTPTIDHGWMFDPGVLVGNSILLSHDAVGSAYFKSGCLSLLALEEN